MNNDQIAAWLNQGLSAHQRGQLTSAKHCYSNILTHDPNHADALHLLGVIYYSEKNYNKAIELITHACDINHNNAAFYSNLGLAYHELKRYQPAINAFKQALSLQTIYPEAEYNLANTYQALADYDNAIRYYQSALQQNPKHAKSWCNLGTVYRHQANIKQAEASFNKALELDSKQYHALYNLGLIYHNRMQLEKAIAFYNQAILIAKLPEAEFGLAQMYLASQQWTLGWPAYEARWQCKTIERENKNFSIPSWEGESLEDKKLLIWGEQGVGDEVMFARFLKKLDNSNVTIECDERLIPIYKRSFKKLNYQTRILNQASTGYDYHCPIGSLPLKLKENIIIETSYLKADLDLSQLLKQKYLTMAKGKPCIGLSWISLNKKETKKRSIELKQWANLLEKLNGFYIDLQPGEHEADLIHLKNKYNIHIYKDTCIDSIKDLDSYLAQINTLDLIITIDNSTAHFAGALGIKTWVFVPYHPEWRWQYQGDKTCWYPNTTVIRQTEIGHWQPAIKNAFNLIATI